MQGKGSNPLKVLQQEYKVIYLMYKSAKFRLVLTVTYLQIYIYIYIYIYINSSVKSKTNSKITGLRAFDLL